MTPKRRAEILLNAFREIGLEHIESALYSMDAIESLLSTAKDNMEILNRSSRSKPSDFQHFQQQIDEYSETLAILKKIHDEYVEKYY